MRDARRAPLEQEIDDAAGVGPTVDVVPDAHDRVAGGRRNRFEQARELGDAAVNVADRKEMIAPVSHEVSPV